MNVKSAKAKIANGRRFGTLTVVGSCTGSGRRMYKVKCDCGVEKFVRKDNLIRAKSCGCKTNEIISKARTRHGETDSPTWKTWKSVIDRCDLKTHKSYKDYGGRGIEVCDRWRTYENFKKDMGERPAGTQVDRINNAGNYEPGNCRWVTAKENANNKRSNRTLTHDGKSMTLSQWAEKTGINFDTIWRRLHNGWCVSAALTQPVKKQKNNRHSISTAMVARGDKRIARYQLSKGDK